MAEEADQDSKKGWRILGWILLVLGLLTIVGSSIVPYSPSFTHEQMDRMELEFAASMIAGSLLVVFGGLILLMNRKKKRV